MVNIVGLRRYYGQPKRNEFENGIRPLVNAIHACALKVRYPSASASEEDKVCGFAGYEEEALPANAQTIAGATNTLNSQLDSDRP